MLTTGTGVGYQRRGLVLTLVVACMVLAGCGDAQQDDAELTATLIMPVARVTLKVEEEAAGKRSGEEIYAGVCTSCHSAGVLGAPATGKAEQWAERLPKGLEELVASVISGMGSMPPRAGKADLTDTEVARAVAYLANQAGANFEEPPLEAE